MMASNDSFSAIRIASVADVAVETSIPRFGWRASSGISGRNHRNTQLLSRLGEYKYLQSARGYLYSSLVLIAYSYRYGREKGKIEERVV